MVDSDLKVGSSNAEGVYVKDHQLLQFDWSKLQSNLSYVFDSVVRTDFPLMIANLSSHQIYLYRDNQLTVVEPGKIDWYTVGYNENPVSETVITNLFEGNIGYFKIAETLYRPAEDLEEGNQRHLSLLCTGGGNYADNEDAPVFCNLCIHRGRVKTNYNTLTGVTYLDFYYRINNGMCELWVSPKKQFPDFISILVLKNNFNRWTVGQLETQRELPAGLVDF